MLEPMLRPPWLRWWLVGGLSALAALAVWCASPDEPAVVQQPPAPRVDVAVVAPPAEPAPSPRPALPTAEAPAAPAEVRDEAIAPVVVRVTRNGLTQVGTRITLRQGAELQSGQLDTFGEVSLPLREGRWELASPGLQRPVTFELAPGQRRVELQLPPTFTLTGTVVDEQGRGVSNAEVRVDAVRGVSDWEGRFVFEVGEPHARVFATTQGQRSAVVEVELPKTDLTIHVEPVWPVKLTATPVREAFARVGHRLGQSTCALPCTLTLPGGESDVLAVSARLGTVLSGKTRLVVREPVDVEVTLKSAPPVTGVLLDTGGRPIAGITVELRSRGLTSEDLLDPDFVPRQVGATVTDAEGRFSLRPRRPLLFGELVLQAPWQLERPALVSLGDGPLTLTAHESEPQ